MKEDDYDSTSSTPGTQIVMVWGDWTNQRSRCMLCQVASFDVRDEFKGA